jgi:dihydrodipicolinate synthase/N-acetylneuraminate lyase
VDGGILAAALFAPAPALALVAAHRVGDRPAVDAAQGVLGPLARDVVAALGPAGLKCAMDLAGLDGGAPRPPLHPCDAAERARVAALLADAGVEVVARGARDDSLVAARAGA